MQDSFWSFTFGNIATLIGLLVTLLKLHWDNVKRSRDSAVEIQDLKNSVNRLLAHEHRFVILESLSAKLDVIYPVFLEALKKGIFNKGRPE